MPFGTLKVQPGVNVELTPALNQGGISESQLIRFRNGLVEKFGGWTKFYPNAISSRIYALNAWADLNGNSILGVGAGSELSVIQGGVKTDLTPQFKTSNGLPVMAATNGSSSISITAFVSLNGNSMLIFLTPILIGGTWVYGQKFLNGLTDNVATSYSVDAAFAATLTTSVTSVPTFHTRTGSAIVSVDWRNWVSDPVMNPSLSRRGAGGGTVWFGASTTVAGVTIYGSYTILDTQPFNANQFSILANHTASSSLIANMTLSTLVYLGQPPNGAQNLPPVTGTSITATDWTLDSFGEDLVACAKGGPLYYWQPSQATQSALPIANGPQVANGAFVAPGQAIIVAYGASIGQSGQQDPLLLRWCDAGDFSSTGAWTADATNQAGSYHISSGSRIVGGRQGLQQAFVWTDVDAWTMQYIQPPLVFSFNKVAQGCGLIGQHAHTAMGQKIYWLSYKQFFQADANGGVAPLECTVWDKVFQDLDTTNASKCVMGSNTQANEIMCFYPSASGGTGDVDSYVKYNVMEGTWDYGTLGRTAWINQSVFGSPIGAAVSTNYIYQHESGVNADGAALETSFKTGWFTLSDGEDYATIDWLMPDFKWGLSGGSQSAQITINIYTADYPSDTPVKNGPFTVTSAIQFVNERCRGRLISFEIKSTDLGSFWRMGAFRFRYIKDGRR